MVEALEALDADDGVGVVVLTGAGDSFSAGMDLKEYFREVDSAPRHVQRKVRRDNGDWQIRMLRAYAKPTIAMVNGWCFGGAFIPLVGCDLAVAADEATFGVSEINWGIPPGSVVSRALAETISARDALLYIMTGRTFDGRRAAEMGLVNWSTPRERLRAEVEELARELLGKNPDRPARCEGRLPAVPEHELGRTPRITSTRSSSSRSSSTARADAPEGLRQFLDEKKHPSRPAELRAPATRPRGPLRGLMGEMPLTLDLVLRRIETVAAPLTVTSAHTGWPRCGTPGARSRWRSRRPGTALGTLGIAVRHARRDARPQQPPPSRALLRRAVQRPRVAHAQRARAGRGS